MRTLQAIIVTPYHTAGTLLFISCSYFRSGQVQRNTCTPTNYSFGKMRRELVDKLMLTVQRGKIRKARHTNECLAYGLIPNLPPKIGLD